MSWTGFPHGVPHGDHPLQNVLASFLAILIAMMLYSPTGVIKTPNRTEEAGIDITDDWRIDSDGGAEVGIPGFEAKFCPVGMQIIATVLMGDPSASLAVGYLIRRYTSGDSRRMIIPQRSCDYSLK